MKLTSPELITYSQGNPGALSFLMQLDKDNTDHQIILSTLFEATAIRGPKLYVLWSDLANRNLNTLYHLCRKVPIYILIDACLREDYSGRDLIEPFMPQEGKT